MQYRTIDVDTDDRPLRFRLIDRYKVLEHLDKNWFWDSALDGPRQGPAPEGEAINYFEQEILDGLILCGQAENDIIVEFQKQIAREMRVTPEQVVIWYQKAWRKVKKLIKS